MTTGPTVSTETMLRIHRPVVDGQEVRFSWETTPVSTLYRRPWCVLRFPPAVDLAKVPPEFWDAAAVLLLHTHAAVLAPCRLVLPIDPGEALVGVLARQIQAVQDTCEWYVGDGWSTSTVDIDVSTGATAPTCAVRGERPFDRPNDAAAAFSGGRDGIVQATMLREFAERVVLVAVSSPMPPTADHVNRWRRRSLNEVPARLGMQLVEVRSDARSVWRLGWAVEHRRALVGIHEITDQVLYVIATAAVAAALGVPEVFMATETEAHTAMVLEDRTVQFQQLTSAGPTLAALDAWLSELCGMSVRCGTGPFRGRQASALLARRAADLTDYVCTCWQVDTHQRACNACSLCLSRTLFLLAEGISPTRIGTDLDRLGAWAPSWRPSTPLHELPRNPRAAISQTNSIATVEAARTLAGDRTRWAADFRASSESHRRWMGALSDRLGGDQLRPQTGWCADLLDAAGPRLRPVLASIGAREFGPGDADGDAVGPSLALARTIVGRTPPA